MCIGWLIKNEFNSLSNFSLSCLRFNLNFLKHYIKLIHQNLILSFFFWFSSRFLIIWRFYIFCFRKSHLHWWFINICTHGLFFFQILFWRSFLLVICLSLFFRIWYFINFDFYIIITLIIMFSDYDFGYRCRFIMYSFLSFLFLNFLLRFFSRFLFFFIAFKLN